MLSTNPLILLVFCAYLTAAQEHWSYDDQAAWGGQCNQGRRQSPIKLSTSPVYSTPFSNALSFKDYDKPLKGPLTIVNNGHSVNLAFTTNTNGNRPTLSGGIKNGNFEAQSVHFHWGSANSKGSEHLIDGVRYDVEMHIVHKNALYATGEEAERHEDGLAVLGVMFKEGDDPNRQYPGIKKLLDTLPQLVNFSSEAPIEGELKVGQLLGDLNTKKFFTYKGSLTTPLCSEAVTWYVFRDALPIPAAQIAKFWNIRDENNELLINNFRDIQPRNDRLIFYRSNSI